MARRIVPRVDDRATQLFVEDLGLFLIFHYTEPVFFDCFYDGFWHQVQLRDRQQHLKIYFRVHRILDDQHWEVGDNLQRIDQAPDELERRGKGQLYSRI